MSFRDQLRAYIAQLEQRLRWSTLLRGLAIFTGSALVATLVLVTLANTLAFSHGSVTGARYALILILAIAAGPVGAALAPPHAQPRHRAAEAAFPQFQQRLTTFAERDGQDPFIELLAATRSKSPAPPSPASWSPMAVCGSRWNQPRALAILVWMIASGPVISLRRLAALDRSALR